LTKKVDKDVEEVKIDEDEDENTKLLK